MTRKYRSPSFFEHLTWLPIRLFMLVCCSAKITGIEHLRKTNSAVIIASNHVTELDPLMIVSCLPFFSRFLPLIYVVRDKSFYRELRGFRKFVYGESFFRIIGGFEAYAGLRNYEKALANHLEALERGFSVCIFPVGRIHSYDMHTRARGGVAYLAAKTGLPVVPLHMYGLRRGTTFKEYLLRKPKLVMAFGEPLYADQLFDKPVSSITPTSQKDCEAAAVKIMHTIAKL